MHGTATLRNAWGRVRELNQHSWFRVVCSLVFAFALVGLMTMAMRVNPYDDDWAISLALSGRYPDSGLCLFVNALLSNATLALNTAFPSMNWFFVIEYVISALAFAALLYALSSSASLLLGCVLIVGVEYFFLPYCTYLSNFTFVAANCTLAGCVLILSTLRSGKVSWIPCSFGIALCGCGFMFRANAFLLALPFFGIAFLYLLMRRSKMLARAKGSPERRALRVKDACFWALPVALVFVVCAGLQVVNAIEWSQPGWSEWRQWNEVRAQISDYPLPAYDDVEHVLAPEGITRDAYSLAASWSTGDTEYFTLERMEAIASVSQMHSLGGIASGAIGFFTSGCLLDRSVLFMLAFLVLSMFLTPKRIWPFIIVLVLVGLGCCAFFFGLGRLPDRVEYPICLYAAAAIVVIAGNEASGSVRPTVRRSVNLVAHGLGVAAVVCMTAYLGFVVARFANIGLWLQTFDQESFQPEGNSIDLALSDDENIYVWNTLDFMTLEAAYEFRFLPSEEFLERNISIGGWSTDSPYIQARNEMVGMTNIVAGLVENDHARYVSSDAENVRHLHEFIRQQYYPEATMQVVDALQDGEGKLYFVYEFAATDAEVREDAAA